MTVDPDAWAAMLPTPSDDKEARFHRVAWSVAVALLRHGEEGVQVADVARRAGVSRAWIYKFFGPDRLAILHFSLRLFGRAFAAPAAAHDGTVEGWRASLLDGSRKGLDDARRAPWCVAVYLRYRRAPGPFGDALRELEAAELRALAERVPKGLRARAEAFVWTFHAARVGVYVLDDGAPGDERLACLMGMVDAFIDGRPAAG